MRLPRRLRGPAARTLVVRTPGCAPPDFWRYDYRNIPRPLWPWDEFEGWEPAPPVLASWLATDR